MDKNNSVLNTEKTYSLTDILFILITTEKDTPFFVEDDENENNESTPLILYSYDHIKNNFIKTRAYKTRDNNTGVFIYELYSMTKVWDITKYDFKKKFKLKFGAGTDWRIVYTLSDNPDYAIERGTPTK